MRLLVGFGIAVVALTQAAYKWEPVVWGGGGYITGFVFHPKVQGLVYVRTDVGGAYRRDPGSKKWIQLLNWLPRPDGDLAGVWSVAVDPTDSNRLYIASGMYDAFFGRNAALLRSTDRGATFQRTEFSFKLNGNGNGRGSGERLQVDPNNPAILYLGTSSNGLWRSTDYGVTFARVTSLPGDSINLVMFDPSSGHPGSGTPHIYVGVATKTSASLLHSTDAGATWKPVPNQPSRLMGLMPLRAANDGAHKVYLSYSDDTGPNGIGDGAVFVYDDQTGTWTDITPEKPGWFGYAGISVSAQSPNIIAVSTIDRWWLGDEIFRSLNGGKTWTLINPKSTHSAPNNEWIQGWRDTKMGSWITDVEIDPFSESHVIYNHGAGLWETESFLCNRCDWFFNVDGIEETCVIGMAAPAQGAMLHVVQGDVGGGRYIQNYTDLHHFSAGTQRGIDYAHWWPNFMARTQDQLPMAFLSWDNGGSWHPIPTQPIVQKDDPGQIAVSSNGGALLWAVGSHSAFFSTDNGNTWGNSTGYPVSDSTTSGRFYHPIADRTTDSYFYTYDFTKGTILQSSNSGRTFTTIFTGLDQLPQWRSNSQLTSVPTKLRDLWLATASGIYHFDGISATAPVKMPNVDSATGITYGAAAPGKSYPALYMTGKVAGVSGVYQSIDIGQTWVRIDDDQHRWNTDLLVGDQRQFGRVFVAQGGRGVVAGVPA